MDTHGEMATASEQTVAPTEQFQFEPLSKRNHRRDEFSCGVNDLDHYLKTQARREMETGVSRCFIAVPKSNPGFIAGFYTLSSAQVQLTELPEDLANRLPRYPLLPVTLLGRLARSIQYKGKGLGDILMADAFQRAMETAKNIGSLGLVVDSKDEKASRF
jgi:hypothetical protein